MRITLPQLERIIYQQAGSKNISRQLLSDKITIEGGISHPHPHSALITQGESQYYFTSRKDDIPREFANVLLTNFQPLPYRFEDGTLKIIKWLKHHLMYQPFTPSEVVASWKNEFHYKEEDLEQGSNGLRQPQIAAVHSIMGHLKLPLDAATVVMPTGTGKTETMLAALVANQCKRLLVTVPSDSLRQQLTNKFLSLGLLKTFGVVGNNGLYPIVGTIKNKFDSDDDVEAFIQGSNVVISTMAWLTSQSRELQEKVAQLFDFVFIDEAHHVKANSWNAFRHKFKKEKVVQFTATPFRNDGKRLEGKIIFNFPLRNAQEQGYYKKIEFLSVRSYDLKRGDLLIADIAVQRLRHDLDQGFNHILMARCATKQRADEVFQLYAQHEDLNPVLIYSGAPNLKKIYLSVLNKESRIIVCVDMLGEGFDLPELKIAAFHDIRKSLPITLQLAGRFTRTKYDEELGNAAFIANIADLNVRSELADLYATDSDWNEILSNTSFERVNEEVDFRNFMEGFQNLNHANIPFQNILPKLSTVVFKKTTDTWAPHNFPAGIPGYDDFEYKFHDLNTPEHMLVVITGKKRQVDWVHHNDIVDVQWDIYVVLWDPTRNLIFINCSENASTYTELANAIADEEPELIRGIDVFKSFYNLKRVKIQNVGLRQFLGKNIRFRMMVGADVGEALSLAEKQRGEKAFVMGHGYEDGDPVNIGASYKGRIWTKMKGDLMTFKNWCIPLGQKLINPHIDPNQILQETLIPKLIAIRPELFPVWIDWDIDMYLDMESKYKFDINGSPYDMSNMELIIHEPAEAGPLYFALKSEVHNVVFELELFIHEAHEDHPEYPDFRINQITTTSNVQVRFGSKTFSGAEFFALYIPTIWFADGSALTGNEHVELKQQIGIYPREAIIAYDWAGVNIRNESQHVTPKVTDSIQYKMIQDMIPQDYDIIYDDDYSGEIADIVTIKVFDEKILVGMYHLKFAIDGVISNQIKNFYEICGQVQKSIHWKHKDGKEFINHLLRRETKSKNGVTCSRLEKGTRYDLEKLLTFIKNEIPVEFQLYLVQPGLSKENASEPILQLLGVTENYVKEFANINLRIIAST